MNKSSGGRIRVVRVNKEGHDIQGITREEDFTGLMDDKKTSKNI